VQDLVPSPLGNGLCGSSPVAIGSMAQIQTACKCWMT
jgi:hypothetical protein